MKGLNWEAQVPDFRRYTFNLIQEYSKHICLPYKGILYHAKACQLIWFAEKLNLTFRFTHVNTRKLTTIAVEFIPSVRMLQITRKMYTCSHHFLEQKRFSATIIIRKRDAIRIKQQVDGIVKPFEWFIWLMVILSSFSVAWVFTWRKLGMSLALKPPCLRKFITTLQNVWFNLDK